jgi:hypothetical protein
MFGGGRLITRWFAYKSTFAAQVDLSIHLAAKLHQYHIVSSLFHFALNDGVVTYPGWQECVLKYVAEI